MGAFTCQASGKAPDVLHYVSPEQLRGDPVDGRSNIFSLGAILYEMATETKAFPGDDADQVRHAIVEATPAGPDRGQPQDSSRAERSHHEGAVQGAGRALSEWTGTGQRSGALQGKCDQGGRQETGATRPGIERSAVASQPRPARQKSPSPYEPQQRGQFRDVTPVSRAQRQPAKRRMLRRRLRQEQRLRLRDGRVRALLPQSSRRKRRRLPQARRERSGQSTFQERASAVAEPVEPATETPSFQVDPSMAEEAKNAARGPSFSEMSELPPLKEVYIAAATASGRGRDGTGAGSVAQPDAAGKTQSAAAGSGAQGGHGDQEDSAQTLSCIRSRARSPSFCWWWASSPSASIPKTPRTKVQRKRRQRPRRLKPARSRRGARLSLRCPLPAQAQPEQVTAGQEAPAVSVVPKYARTRRRPRLSPAAAATVIPGQLTINSTPEGAEVRIDGRSDPSWVTPFNLPGLSPGQHSVTVARAGYAPESRTIDVASGSKSFLVIQLAQLTAAAAISSQPAGAQIFIDGKDTGRVTPAQISVDKPGVAHLPDQEAGLPGRNLQRQPASRTGLPFRAHAQSSGLNR